MVILTILSHPTVTLKYSIKPSHPTRQLAAGEQAAKLLGGCVQPLLARRDLVGPKRGVKAAGRLLLAARRQPAVRGHARPHLPIEQQAAHARVRRHAHRLVEVGALAQDVRHPRRRRAHSDAPRGRPAFRLLPLAAHAHVHHGAWREARLWCRGEW